jgi:hypothetical protein
MLHVNPNKRITIEEIWKHPWVKEGMSSDQVKEFQEIKMLFKEDHAPLFFNKNKELQLSPKLINAFELLDILFAFSTKNLLNKE